MRVIAGEARGRRLEALPGTDVTRPTLSQVKEAMFSIVQFDLPGARVLDLYAGSGQLGIEALSRGAARCVFLDENREAVNIVMRTARPAACSTAAGSISARRRGISRPAGSSSIWCCWTRPSAAARWKRSCPPWTKCVAPGGIVLCESETGIVLPAAGGRSDPAETV